jgi:hypothetical protein
MSWPTFPIQSSRLISAFRGDFNDIIDAIVTAFVGASEPTVKYSCMLWADTAQGVLKQRNVANTAWIVRGQLEVDYGGALPLSGGTMAGALDMGGYGISNLPAGSGNAPARYADLAAYVKADGTVAFTGFPSLPSGSPSLDVQAAHKKYVDDTSKAGGSFTGQITMTVAPTASQHVMRKTDVETVRDTHTHSGGAGMGSKIPGSSINSQTSPDGYLLKANGDGTTSFAEIHCDSLVFPTEVQTIGQVSSSGSWQVGIDLSTVVTVDCYAILIGTAPVSNGVFTVRFRAYGTSGTGALYRIGSTEPTNERMMIVPVIDRKIDVYALRTDGSGNLYLKTYGYFRRMA